MTPPDPAARVALVALIATTAIQIFTSLAVATPAVLAPALAPDLGITPQWIGVFIGLVYAGAMLGSLAAGGFIAQLGSIRLSQLCVLLCAVGIALVALLPGSAAALLVAAAFLLGLGYGPITPASSAVLIRTTPPSRMALTFSIKQTGVPAGAALAGAVMPGVALLLGWRAALIGVAIAGLVVIAAAEPTRRALDTARTAGQSFSLKALLRPLRSVWKAPELRALSLTGFAFASVQVCLSSFLVIFLFETLRWSLVASGLALTCATISAVCCPDPVGDRFRPMARPAPRAGRHRRHRGPLRRDLGQRRPRMAGVVRARGGRAVRRQRDRLERRPARGTRPAGPSGKRGRRDGRVGLRDVRRRHGRSPGVRRTGGGERQLPYRVLRSRGGERRCRGGPAPAEPPTGLIFWK